MPTDIETITDILTLQADIRVEAFVTDGRVDMLKELRIDIIDGIRVDRFGLHSINHAHQGMVLLTDNTFLTEEVDGECNGQQGNKSHSKADDV